MQLFDYLSEYFYLNALRNFSGKTELWVKSNFKLICTEFECLAVWLAEFRVRSHFSVSFLDLMTDIGFYNVSPKDSFLILLFHLVS